MKYINSLILFVMILSINQVVFAQVDLNRILPVYPGAKISAMDSNEVERIVITTTDDIKAVMLYYKKMLVYDGWTVLKGEVLKSDPIIVFARDGVGLSMQADITNSKVSAILFEVSE